MAQLISNSTDISTSVKCEGCPRVSCAVELQRANSSFCALRRTLRHARSTLLGSGGDSASEQNNQAGTSGQPLLNCSFRLRASTSNSSSARPAVIPTDRPEPLLTAKLGGGPGRARRKPKSTRLMNLSRSADTACEPSPIWSRRCGISRHPSRMKTRHSADHRIGDPGPSGRRTAEDRVGREVGRVQRRTVEC